MYTLWLWVYNLYSRWVKKWIILMKNARVQTFVQYVWKWTNTYILLDVSEIRTRRIFYVPCCAIKKVRETLFSLYSENMCFEYIRADINIIIHRTRYNVNSTAHRKTLPTLIQNVNKNCHILCNPIIKKVSAWKMKKNKKTLQGVRKRQRGRCSISLFSRRYVVSDFKTQIMNVSEGATLRNGYGVCLTVTYN